VYGAVILSLVLSLPTSRVGLSGANVTGKVTHPSTNRAWCWPNALIKTNGPSQNNTLIKAESCYLQFMFKVIQCHSRSRREIRRKFNTVIKAVHFLYWLLTNFCRISCCGCSKIWTGLRVQLTLKCFRLLWRYRLSSYIKSHCMTLEVQQRPCRSSYMETANVVIFRSVWMYQGQICGWQPTSTVYMRVTRPITVVCVLSKDSDSAFFISYRECRVGSPPLILSQTTDFSVFWLSVTVQTLSTSHYFNSGDCVSVLCENKAVMCLQVVREQMIIW